MTVADAASLLGVTRQRVYVLVKTGRIRVVGFIPRRPYEGGWGWLLDEDDVRRVGRELGRITEGR